MTRKRIGRKSTSKDANRRLPEDLTTWFIDQIQQLEGEDPKVQYLKSVFLDKFVSSDTDPPSVRRQRAINKWLAAERDNEATNERLLITHGEYNILPRVTFDSFVKKAQEVILSIVGEMPRETDFIGGFSGGASTSKRRTESHPASKYLGKADITSEALPYWELVIGSCEGWASFSDQLVINEVRGNVLFTVPKNTSIDRVAAKEPDLNMFMQKGLGSRIREGLRQHGINLNDQSRNRALAREGSITGELATLDLSSASDSVTRELVWRLMPFLWFVSLDALRCKVTLIDGIEHSNEMFSSMGNGFTFELESLLFYALARTTAYFRGVRGVISVYGDDIIVPSCLAHDLTWVLGYFGFGVNPDKSFITGSFRESCGGHFVNGLDVTPFYLRKPLSKVTDLIHMANALRKWSEYPEVGICDPEVYPLWARMRDLIPRSLWGGREYSSIYQLVSPHLPKAVLRPKKVTSDTGDGGYIHWLCATHRRKRAGEGLSTSEKSVEFPFYRPAKAQLSTVTRLSCLFLEEVSDAEC